MHSAMVATLREMVVEYMQLNSDDPDLQLLATTRIEADFPGIEGDTDAESVINL